MESFIIICGDKRQKALVKCLRDSSFKVSHLTKGEQLKDISLFSHVVLPVPTTKDSVNVYSDDGTVSVKLREVIDALNENQELIGFGFSEEIKEMLEERNIAYYDISSQDNFAVNNAYLTAQGCLRLLLDSTEDYISGSKALIIGFGRVACALSLSLKALGLDVTIAARNAAQLQKAKCLGYKAIKLGSLEHSIYYFDYIFGTVPKTILTYNSVKLIRDDSIYFELASKPYTANKEDFTSLGKRYVFGGSLPGRYLPIASGKLIYEEIMQHISRMKE